MKTHGPHAGVLLLVLAALPGAAAGQYEGFAPARLADQQRCEARLLTLPTPDGFRDHLRTITAEPHPTGSAAQTRVATYLAGALQRAGFEVGRHPYDVYLPLLDSIVVEAEIVAPTRERLVNLEPAVPGDEFSGHPGLMPGWNAYSGSGDVTGPVVYVNFGRKEDFERLEALGVEVRGRIVLARYGGNFRGYKVKFAEERGALGVIMFNDPGFARDGAYPDGPNMTPLTIQRGSVLTLDWTGDPLTPFEPALPLDGTGRVERLDPADVGLHTIPVLPIGYGAAERILARMTGQAVPAGWSGGLDTPYRLTGGDDLRVRVHVRQPKGFVRAVNVIGTLRGTERPDEWVILGAHYDPWGFGALDPNGGTAMLMTLADALGQLARDGCGPRRSVMIAHWDAEEYGIIGSTEWVEHYRDELTTNAVAYINADAAVSGPSFSSSASPTLKKPIIDATRAVPYPDGGTVFDVWSRGSRGSEPALGDLGGGSDHVAFYTHAGVPSAGLSIGGSNGVYHSNYDNFAFFSKFSDPEFIYGPTLARVDGILALRMANADIVPYDVARYGTDTGLHAARLEELAADRGLDVRLDALKAAATAVSLAGRAYATARDRRLQAGTLNAAAVDALNAELIALEKALLHPEGLQGRPWSRSLYASPDPFSGYASWMLPGLRYEIETDNTAGARAWEEVYVTAMRALESRIRALTDRLDTAGRSR